MPSTTVSESSPSKPTKESPASANDVLKTKETGPVEPPPQTPDQVGGADAPPASTTISSSHNFLVGHDIILASVSPRRLALLQQIGIPVTVIPSTFEENLPKSCTPAEYVTATADAKARQVFDEHRGSVVIAADTVVVLDNTILEKPRDDDHARQMLRDLGGRTHSVVTGVCIRYGESRRNFHVESRVTFAEVGEELVEWYVATGEPRDKAGGYGIQGQGAVLVEQIAGCYFNVVGLPIHRVYRELRDLLAK